MDKATDIDATLKEIDPHYERVGILMGKFLRYLAIETQYGIDFSLLKDPYKIGLYHDIGKSLVDKSILDKPNELTKEEYAIVKLHVNFGVYILDQLWEHNELDSVKIDTYKHIRDCVSSHHERWDGKGYPLSLVGEDIPLTGRICAIIDSFDVMTNSRKYKQAYTFEHAEKELILNSSTQFDPILVEHFLNFIRRTGI